MTCDICAGNKRQRRMQRTHALSCPHGMCVVLNMNMSLVTCCDLSLSVFSVVLNSFSVLSARYAVWRLRGIKKHTGIKKPRETGDFRDPTSARRNARPEKGHIPSAHRQKRHRQDSPMSCTLRPSAVRAHSHIELSLEPFPSAHRISNHCLSLFAQTVLARKSILFSAPPPRCRAAPRRSPWPLGALVARRSCSPPDARGLVSTL